MSSLRVAKNTIQMLATFIGSLKETRREALKKIIAHFEDIVLIRETTYPPSLSRTFGQIQPNPPTP